MGKDAIMRKDCVARELTMEMVVGVFMVMIFLGMGYFTIILSREPLLGEKHALEVAFQDVMGLREGDNVVVRGMPIGRVKELVLGSEGVHVMAVLDEPIHMKKDYRITIVTTSILGGRYMEIQEGSAEYPDLAEGMVYRGKQPHDLMADAAELVNAVKLGVVEGGVVDNIRASADQFQQIIARVNAGEGFLGRLLSEDDTLYDDLAATAASLKNVSERLDKGEGSLAKLLSSDDTLYEDLSASLASLRQITSQIEEGKGMVGRLIQDDGLYEQVEEIVGEIRATVDDYRETAPITTFSSIFFGAF